MSKSFKITHTELANWRLTYQYRDNFQKLYDHFKGKVIVLAGVPGVGKSLLGMQMANLIGGVYYPEYVNKHLLNLFLKNMDAYSFVYQIIMAQMRIKTYEEAINKARQGYAVIVDGPLICDNAFAKMHWRKGRISDDEYLTYQKTMVEEVSTKLYEPDYMVYLDCSTDKSLERIKKRGRPGEYEAYTANDYIGELRRTFSEVFLGVTVNRIDYEEDFVDEKGALSVLRIQEILGMLRDRTFERISLPATYDS